MSFSVEKFRERMQDVHLIRGWAWNPTREKRFEAVFWEYDLDKFHSNDLEYCVRRLKSDDAFDERALVSYMRQSRAARTGNRAGETMEEYGKRMESEIGPEWKVIAKESWAFISKKMSVYDTRQKYMMGGRTDPVEQVDTEEFHRRMHDKYPGVFPAVEVRDEQRD
jgi:hypothetical protein